MRLLYFLYSNRLEACVPVGSAGIAAGGSRLVPSGHRAVLMSVGASLVVKCCDWVVAVAHSWSAGGVCDVVIW